MQRITPYLLMLLGIVGCFKIDIGDSQSDSAARLAPAPPPPPASTPIATRPPEFAELPLAAGLAATPVAAQEDEGGWMGILKAAGRAATEITLGAERGALFYGFDTLAYPEQSANLTARLQKAENLQNVVGATIGFYQAGKQLAQAQTNENGLATISFTPPKAGDYSFEAKILTLPADANQDMLKVSPAIVFLSARPKETPIVVVDLDYTLVSTGFHTVLLSEAKPMADSQTVLEELAKSHTIVYLTQRPDLLAKRSRAWLNEQKYPPGPLLVGTLKAVIGGSGQFKTAKLAEMRQAYPQLKIGIGDKVSDAQSYADNGMRAVLIPHYKNKPKDMRQLASEIRQLHGDIQVVQNWQQVRQAIVENKSFPPRQYADWLDKQAAGLRDD